MHPSILCPSQNSVGRSEKMPGAHLVLGRLGGGVHALVGGLVLLLLMVMMFGKSSSTKSADA